MQKFLMCATILIAAALAASNAADAAPKDTGKGGVSCTYDLCMSRCKSMSGVQCNRYCDKQMIERKMTGACPK